MDLRTMIYRYCNYQERCQKEVRNRLFKAGADREEVGQLMADLISDGLLDEERYARSFARGRFRMKHWGRKKIIYALRQDQISDYCIRKALEEIDETEYEETLRQLAGRKLPELRAETNMFARRMKLQRYLVQKGFENELVNTIVASLI